MDTQRDNEIPVYKDQVIMDISGRFHALDSERIGLILSEGDGERSMTEINKDMVVELEAMNTHLRAAYPENRAAKIYLSTNQFFIDRLKEEIQGP